MRAFFRPRVDIKDTHTLYATASIGIHVKDVSYSYDTTPLFSHITLSFPAGQFSVILGASGSGKSTLLNMIAGHLTPTEGVIAASDKAPLAHRIAYMHQQDMLLPWASALNNIVIGSKLRCTSPDYEKAYTLLEKVGLSESAHKKPEALSGGMRQRVALARTLYEDRPIILMDEPFSALDSINRTLLQNLALQLLRNKTVLMITHDPMEACRMGEYILVAKANSGGFFSPLLPESTVPRQIGHESFHALHTTLAALLEQATLP